MVSGGIHEVLLEAPILDVDGEVDGAGAEALVGRCVGDGVVCNEAVEDALLELGEVGVDLEGREKIRLISNSKRVHQPRERMGRKP